MMSRRPQPVRSNVIGTAASVIGSDQADQIHKTGRSTKPTSSLLDARPQPLAPAEAVAGISCAVDELHAQMEVG
jgi:hypothetical protein